MAGLNSNMFASAASAALDDVFAKLMMDMKSHPAAAIGTGALSLLNLGGLINDRKFGGQLVGSLAGEMLGAGLASKHPLSPMARLAISSGGGALGSFFDTYRGIKARKAKRQEQMAQPPQMPQYPTQMTPYPNGGPRYD